MVLIQFILESNSYNALQIKRYMASIRMIEDSRREGLSREKIDDMLSSSNLEISDIKLETLMKSNVERIDNKDEPVESFYYNEKKFVHFKHRKPPFMKMHSPPPKDFDFKPEEIILIDNFDEKKIKNLWLVILFTIDSLLIWFLIFLRKKLNPLLLLKENMINLSKGKLSISNKINGKDEISQVSNEFNNAMKQLKELRGSRNLFLRNIMHELKTPITKGKLISDTLDENERKYILIRVFQRLEYLLSEFSKIEELTSGKINLQKNQYRAIDIIDQAYDILLIDSNKIEIEIEHNYNLIVDVDFDFFAIALKNLIDNALQYNTSNDIKIFIEKKEIRIVNRGEKLKKDIDEYYKPFNHEYETTSRGLGLGLYISNNIIKIHNFELQYKYIDGYHHFIIYKK